MFACGVRVGEMVLHLVLWYYIAPYCECESLQLLLVVTVLRLQHPVHAAAATTAGTSQLATVVTFIVVPLHSTAQRRPLIVRCSPHAHCSYCTVLQDR